MVAEVDRIASTAQFNGKTLLDGSLSDSIQASDQLSIQLGIDGQESSRINLNAELNLAASNSAALGINDLSATTAEDAQKSLDKIEDAFAALSSARGRAGAVQNRFSKAVGSIGASIETLTAADSTIRDADIAEEIAILTRNQIVTQASVTMIGQSNLAGQNLLNILQ